MEAQSKTSDMSETLSLEEVRAAFEMARKRVKHLTQLEREGEKCLGNLRNFNLKGDL